MNRDLGIRCPRSVGARRNRHDDCFVALLYSILKGRHGYQRGCCVRSEGNLTRRTAKRVVAVQGRCATQCIVQRQGALRRRRNGNLEGGVVAAFIEAAALSRDFESKWLTRS